MTNLGAEPGFQGHTGHRIITGFEEFDDDMAAWARQGTKAFDAHPPTEQNELLKPSVAAAPGKYAGMTTQEAIAAFAAEHPAVSMSEEPLSSETTARIASATESKTKESQPTSFVARIKSWFSRGK